MFDLLVAQFVANVPVLYGTRFHYDFGDDDDDDFDLGDALVDCLPLVPARAEMRSTDGGGGDDGGDDDCAETGARVHCWCHCWCCCSAGAGLRVGFDAAIEQDAGFGLPATQRSSISAS